MPALLLPLYPQRPSSITPLRAIDDCIGRCTHFRAASPRFRPYHLQLGAIRAFILARVVSGSFFVFLDIRCIAPSSFSRCPGRNYVLCPSTSLFIFSFRSSQSESLLCLVPSSSLFLDRLDSRKRHQLFLSAPTYRGLSPARWCRLASLHTTRLPLRITVATQKRICG